MKGMVFDIKRFAIHDGPGIRTIIFFKGCQLKCIWCHNPEGFDIHTFFSIKKIILDGQCYDQQEQIGKVMSVKEIMDIVIREKITMEESGGGVTISGGEPLMQPEFLMNLLIACKKEGIHTAVDTNGYADKKVLKKIIPYTDLFLFDLKHYDSFKHKAGTGVSNEVILNNLKFLLENQKNIRIRIPVIPDFNFNDHDLLGILNLLKSLPGSIDQIDLLPYHTTANNKYKRFGIKNPMNGIPGLTKGDLTGVKELFLKEGFQVNLGG